METEMFPEGILDVFRRENLRFRPKITMSGAVYFAAST